MYVNPFERIRKVREEKEQAEKEAQAEREKYARLGAQMGLTKANGVVPSFMQTMMRGDDQGANVPPFGTNMGSSEGFSPMPSSPMASSPSRKQEVSMKDLSLPGGGGAKVAVPVEEDFEVRDDGFVEPSKPVFEMEIGNDFESSAPSTPSFPAGMPSTSNMPNPTSQFSNSENSPTPQNIPPFGGSYDTFDPTQEDIDEVTAEFDDDFTDSFFDTDDVEIKANNTQNPSLKADISTIIDSVNDMNSSKQFFAIYGMTQDITNETDQILSSLNNMNKIEIDIKRVFLYSSPYLFLMKKFINQLPQVSAEDKRVLWERVALFLAATEYGNNGTDIHYLFEESLEIDDPILSIGNEFKDVLEAYGIQESLVIAFRDFRGLEFSDISKLISFITSVFTGITQIKIVFEINKDIILNHFKKSSSASWMDMFDQVLDTSKSVELKIDEALEDEVDGLFGMLGASNNDNSSFDSQPFNQSPAMPSFGAPSAPEPSFSAPSAPTPSFGASMPTESPMGFVAPSLPTKQEPSQHSAVQEVQKEVEQEDNPIRIRVDLNLQKLENEKLEMEVHEQNLREKQLIQSSIDPSILADEDKPKAQAQGVDIFANFNADGWRNAAEQEAGLTGVKGSDVKDPRSYDQVRDKLNDLRVGMEDRGSIDIGDEAIRLEERPKKNENAIPVPGNWAELK